MIGSLFSGYGGLDMAVEAITGEPVAWFVEYDDAPSKILAHHWPTIPNYGDVATLDWSTVPPITILTAGYPCQPFSTAGSRKGSNDERHLWPYALAAIRYLRPKVVVLENVRGHLTLGFDRVLLDLAEAGYDAEWICLPASDAGAPHKRERLFIVASPRYAEGDGGRVGRESRGAGQAERGRVQETWSPVRGDPGSADRAATHPQDIGRERRGSARQRRAGSADGGDIAPDTHHTARDGEWSRTESGQGDTPASNSDRSGLGVVGRIESEQCDADRRGSADQLWGHYEPAIRRWESVLGRFAPAPTLPDGRGGNHRLSPAFVEWMMGLPAGHVTATDTTRAQQLKALGNGVVPQQAALALSILLEHEPHHKRPTEEA